MQVFHSWEALWLQCGYCLPHIKPGAAAIVKTEHYRGAKELSGTSPLDLHSVTGREQIITRRMESEARRREAAMIWDAAHSKGMREDIESESRENSTKRYATSHERHGGNTGSVWHTWWPDWKICKKKEKNHKCGCRLLGPGKKPMCFLYLPAPPRHSPHSALSVELELLWWRLHLLQFSHSDYM